MSTVSKKFRIPKLWSDITLGQQVKLETLVSDGVNKTIAFISAYCNLEVDFVKTLHIDEVKEIFDSMEFIKVPIDAVPVTEFDFNGEHYSVMESLMKAQFQDFISLEAVLDNNKGKEYKALPMLVAIMSKRKVADVLIGTKDGKQVYSTKYEVLDDIDLDKRSELFKALPLTIAHGIYSFFLSSAMHSSITSKVLINQLEESMQKSLNSIEDSTLTQVGIRWSYRLLRGILQRYARFIVFQWKRSFSTSQS